MDSNSEKTEIISGDGSTKFDLLIIFRDTSRKIIKNVSSYGCYDGNLFYYTKNGYSSFMPVDAITFIGRNFDYLS